MILAALIDLYTLVVFASVVISWIGVSSDNPIVKVVISLTEPVLAPLRKVLPSAGGLDFSPMVLLIGLQILRRLLFH